jgi:probable F420-dependent oxidoreductase
VLGFALPQCGDLLSRSSRPRSTADDLVRFASTAESLGAASLWVGDRLLAPVHPSVGYGGTDTMPPQFRSFLDPFVALTAAAAATSSVRLGSSVLVAPWYPPVALARQLTSLDVFSGGRVTVGLGVGWSPDEFEAAGAEFASRGGQLDELLDVLDAWWTTNPVRHVGRRWSVPESWVDLKPAQRPRPPVFLGAASQSGLARIGRRADGWLPVVQVPGGVRLDALARARKTIDEAAVAAGREPGDIATNVRINVAAAAELNDVAQAVRLLADNGYTDAFVDLMYVAADIDARLDWAQKLLDAGNS